MGMYRMALLLIVLLGVPAGAQTAASIAVNAGSATDITGVGASALTVAPSFTRVEGLSTSSISASATKFANDAWSAGIGMPFRGRASAAAVAPVIDLSLSGATTSYDVSYG